MIDFVCMANEAYLRWTELCIRSIERRQPSSTIHLFDLTEARDNRLRSAFATHPRVRITHFPSGEWVWPAWIDSADFDFIWPNFGMRETLKYYSRRLRKALGVRNENWMTDKAAHVRRVRAALRLFAQKPYVIGRALAAARHDLVFIDVDAVVLKPLDAVFDFEFDFAVTAEPPQDVIVGPEPPECTDRPHYPYKAINVGVMFVRNNDRVRPLLQAWIREMETVRHLSIEQTALAHLIQRLVPDFYQQHYRPASLRLEGALVSVMALPMNLYNFTHLRRQDALVAPDKFVAHFCGGKKQEQHWPWVQKMISDTLQRADMGES
jgi:hypothetical protein